MNRISEPKLNRKKTKAVILYILSKLGATSRKKLISLLYFVDYDWYELKEKHLTGLKYIRPVECFKNKKHPTGEMKVKNTKSYSNEIIKELNKKEVIRLLNELSQYVKKFKTTKQP